jgi:hypothetical protein
MQSAQYQNRRYKQQFDTQSVAEGTLPKLTIPKVY